jgi:hypothetical protein
VDFVHPTRRCVDLDEMGRPSLNNADIVVPDQLLHLSRALTKPTIVSPRWRDEFRWRHGNRAGRVVNHELNWAASEAD